MVDFDTVFASFSAKDMSMVCFWIVGLVEIELDRPRRDPVVLRIHAQPSEFHDIDPTVTSAPDPARARLFSASHVKFREGDGKGGD
jgi:hypothetical protein